MHQEAGEKPGDEAQSRQTWLGITLVPVTTLGGIEMCSYEKSKKLVAI